MASFDCIIIGGGPAGLTAALYLARFRRSVFLVDDGCSRAKLIPEIANLPAFMEGGSGVDLLDALELKLRDYAVDRRSGRVAQVARAQSGFECTVDGEIVSASRLLLATGIKDGQPEMQGHDAAVRDRLVRYCPICDGFEGQGQRLCVLGPFGSAAPKARFLRSYSHQVTLAFADDPDQAELDDLASCGIETVPAANPPRLSHDSGVVRLLMRDGRQRSFDAVYPVLGAKPASALATALGAQIDDAGCLVVDDKNRTASSGLYAAGDVVSDLHQVVVAMGHAAIAATAVHRSLAENLYPAPPR